MNTSSYYTLLIRQETTKGHIWTQQFGDTDLQVVQQEKYDSWINTGEVKGSNAMIINTLFSQEAIDREVAIMNKEEADAVALEEEIIRDRSVRQNLDITKDNFTELIKLKARLELFPILWDDDTQPDALRLIDNAVESLHDLIQYTYDEYNSEGK